MEFGSMQAPGCCWKSGLWATNDSPAATGNTRSDRNVSTPTRRKSVKMQTRSPSYRRWVEWIMYSAKPKHVPHTPAFIGHTA